MYEGILALCFLLSLRASGRLRIMSKDGVLFTQAKSAELLVYSAE